MTDETENMGLNIDAVNEDELKENGFGFNLLKAARSSKVLSNEDFNKLFFKWQIEDCKESYEKLITNNIKLVIKIAKKKNDNKNSVLEDDLIQSGMMGLEKALSMFEPEMGYRFSTYATNWIKEYMNREIINTAGTIRVPSHLAKEINKYSYVLSKLPVDKQNAKGVYEKLKEENYDPVTVYLNQARVEKVLKIMESTRTYSIDFKVEGQESFFLDRYSADISNDTSEVVEKKQEEERIKNIVIEIITGSLDERAQQIIMKRFGVLGYQKHTLEELGKEFGVSRERIRQIESSAVEKIKYVLKRRNIKL